MTSRLPPPIAAAERNIRVALLCAGLAAGMVGMAYAAVPLYRLFCQVTGYDGTTQRAAAAPGSVIDRTMTIEFDANTGPGLPWAFQPVQRRLIVKLGEESIAYYRAANNSNRPVTGSAVFNVTPDLAGQYFSKIQCFCFVEQTLKPGEKIDLPVVFFVDPAIEKNLDLAALKTITLSYTFFPVAPDRVSGARPSTDVVN